MKSKVLFAAAMSALVFLAGCGGDKVVQPTSTNIPLPPPPVAGGAGGGKAVGEQQGGGKAKAPTNTDQ